MAYDYRSLIRIGKWSTHSFVASPTADSAAWQAKVFRCKQTPATTPTIKTNKTISASIYASASTWKKHRGGRGGIKHRLQAQPRGSSLLNFLLANVKALDIKLDNLHGPCTFRQ